MKLDFKKNIGTTERIIRLIIGLSLLGLGYSKKTTSRLSVFTKVIGFVQLVEAFFAYCFVHDLMGWSTYKNKSHLVLNYKKPT